MAYSLHTQTSENEDWEDSPRLLVLALAVLTEGDAARDGGVAPVRANRGGGLPGVVTEINNFIFDWETWLKYLRLLHKMAQVTKQRPLCVCDA